MSKNEKKFKPNSPPHAIHIGGRMGRQLYNHRIEMMDNFYPQVRVDEEASVLGVAHILNQLCGNMLINHPVYDMKCMINHFVGPSAAYLMACGRYAEDFLKAVRLHVSKNNKILNVGAGFGLASVLAAQCSENLVLAVEPYPELHSLIQGNAKENNVNIKVIQGCLVAGEKGGMCHLYVDEDVWGASIYKDISGGTGAEIINVPIVTLQSLLQDYDVDTVLIDAPGGELSLLEEHQELSAINKLIVRINKAFMRGENSLPKFMKSMRNAGLYVENVVGDVYVFSRDMK